MKPLIAFCGTRNLDARTARALVDMAELAWDALSHQIRLTKAFTLITLDALNREAENGDASFEQAVI